MVQMLYLYQPHALRNSSLSGTVRAEPVGVLTEFCFTYRFHDLQNTLLYDPIYDSWDSQRSGLSIGLWYLHSPYGSWMIITELFPYEMDVFSVYFSFLAAPKSTQASSPFGLDFLCHTRSCVCCVFIFFAEFDLWLSLHRLLIHGFTGTVPLLSLE